VTRVATVLIVQNTVADAKSASTVLSFDEIRAGNGASHFVAVLYDLAFIIEM